MRGAALFFITIVLVTASGRTALEEFAGQINFLLAQSPYSYVILAFMAFSALLCLLVMRDPSKDKSVVYLVRREARGDCLATTSIRNDPRYLTQVLAIERGLHSYHSQRSH